MKIHLITLKYNVHPPGKIKILGSTLFDNSSHQPYSTNNHVVEHVNIFTKILTLFVEENNVNTRRI